MKTTKTISGKNKIVTTTDVLRVGDTVRIVEGHKKNGQAKLSYYGYPITKMRDHRVVEITMRDDNDVEYTRLLTVQELRLELITTVEVHAINVEFTCRETGLQRTVVNAHDFTFGEQECELCGSHGSLEVDIKCKCGKTHTVELKSW